MGFSTIRSLSHSSTRSRSLLLSGGHKNQTQRSHSRCQRHCVMIRKHFGSSDKQKSPFSFNYFIHKVCLTFDSINTLIFIFCFFSFSFQFALTLLCLLFAVLPFSLVWFAACMATMLIETARFFMTGPTAPKHWQFHLKFRIILKGFK